MNNASALRLFVAGEAVMALVLLSAIADAFRPRCNQGCIQCDQFALRPVVHQVIEASRTHENLSAD